MAFFLTAINLYDHLTLLLLLSIDAVLMCEIPSTRADLIQAIPVSCLYFVFLGFLLIYAEGGQRAPSHPCDSASQIMPAGALKRRTMSAFSELAFTVKPF